METFIQAFNANTKRPITDKDLASLSTPDKNRTVTVANQINNSLRQSMNCQERNIVPAKFNHKKEPHVLEVIALPETCGVSNDSSLRIICSVRDLKALDEPKFFILTQYNLDVAKPDDVIAGLLLSFITGPLNQLEYEKLKIDVLKYFIKALNEALLK